MENTGFKIEEEEHKDLLKQLARGWWAAPGEIFCFIYENCWEYISQSCADILKQEIRAQFSRMHQFVQWTLLSAYYT